MTLFLNRLEEALIHTARFDVERKLQYVVHLKALFKYLIPVFLLKFMIGYTLLYYITGSVVLPEKMIPYAVALIAFYFELWPICGAYVIYETVYLFPTHFFIICEAFLHNDIIRFSMANSLIFVLYCGALFGYVIMLWRQVYYLWKVWRMKRISKKLKRRVDEEMIKNMPSVIITNKMLVQIGMCYFCCLYLEMSQEKADPYYSMKAAFVFISCIGFTYDYAWIATIYLISAIYDFCFSDLYSTRAFSFRFNDPNFSHSMRVIAFAVHLPTVMTQTIESYISLQVNWLSRNARNNAANMPRV